MFSKFGAKVGVLNNNAFSRIKERGSQLWPLMEQFTYNSGSLGIFLQKYKIQVDSLVTGAYNIIVLHAPVDGLRIRNVSYNYNQCLILWNFTF